MSISFFYHFFADWTTTKIHTIIVSWSWMYRFWAALSSPIWSYFNKIIFGLKGAVLKKLTIQPFSPLFLVHYSDNPFSFSRGKNPISQKETLFSPYKLFYCTCLRILYGSGMSCRRLVLFKPKYQTGRRAHVRKKDIFRSWKVFKQRKTIFLKKIFCFPFAIKPPRQ